MAVGLGLIFGFRNYLFIQLIIIAVGGGAGVWLFYVQHQFDGVYWERGEDWDYTRAALEGSSFYKLPKVLQWFSGNIGYHHIHHLSSRIPNYNLQRAHDENPIFHDVPTISLWDGMRAVRLKLWDDQARKLVTFAQARRGLASATASATA